MPDRLGSLAAHVFGLSTPTPSCLSHNRLAVLVEPFLRMPVPPAVLYNVIQPYANGQLPNLTIRTEMLALMLMLPVQVDHLKRSQIGIVVMGLYNSKKVG